MAEYKSLHTGEEIDEAVDIQLGNRNKGNSTTPVFIDEDGVATPITKATTPEASSNNLLTSGGLYGAMQDKYKKVDIATATTLGTSNTVVPSQKAVKTYADTELAKKQDKLTAGPNLAFDGNKIILNESSDVVTVSDLDNKREYLPKLEVGYGEKLVEKMERAKRSTFDRNKFTIVGSPTISDEGIASEFSGSNYLTIPFDVTRPFEIKFRARNSSSATQNTSTFMSLSQWQNSIVSYSPTTFNCWLATTNPEFIRTDAEKNLSVTVQPGKWYDFYLKWDGTTYTFGAEGATHMSYDSIYPLKLNTAKLLYLGLYRSLTNGFIDLKQFSITVDGVEVFNGNKTGIDQIKKDDYTKVGNVIVSDDGILYPYTDNTKYVNIPLTSVTNSTLYNHSWKFEGSFIYNTYSNLSTLFCLDYWVGLGGLMVDVNGKFRFYGRYGVTGDLTPEGLGPIIENANWIVGEKYNYSIEFDINTGVYTLILKGGSGYYKSTYTPTSTNKQLYCLSTASPSTSFGINKSIGQTTWYGKFIQDLNDFKVYVDGNLIYQPTLRIPYTQSKTNEKIVDAIYRDRVEDMYEQFNYTYYYTIGDEPEKYNVTKVGSPTLVGGVASGFSSGNYLRLPYLFDAGNKDFEFTFKANKTSTSTGYIWSYRNVSSGYILGVSIGSSNKISWRIDYDSTTQTIIREIVSNTILQLNTDYYIKIGVKNKKGYIKLSTDGRNYTLEKETTDEISSFRTYYDNRIGANTGTNIDGFFNGSIDLSQFSIEVDGKEVYHAYTPARPEYTLATARPADLIETYSNGPAKYEQQANLRLKQSGNATSGTPVTFTKAYKDSNYALDIPYSAKAPTGFTPSESGSWTAIGYAYLN